MSGLSEVRAYLLVDENHEGSAIFRDGNRPLLDDISGVSDEVTRSKLERGHFTFIAGVVLYAREAPRTDLNNAVGAAESVEDGQLGEGRAAERAMSAQVSFDPIVS